MGRKSVGEVDAPGVCGEAHLGDHVDAGCPGERGCTAELLPSVTKRARSSPVSGRLRWRCRGAALLARPQVRARLRSAQQHRQTAEGRPWLQCAMLGQRVLPQQPRGSESHGRNRLSP